MMVFTGCYFNPTSRFSDAYMGMDRHQVDAPCGRGVAEGTCMQLATQYSLEVCPNGFDVMRTIDFSEKRSDPVYHYDQWGNRMLYRVDHYTYTHFVLNIVCLE